MDSAIRSLQAPEYVDGIALKGLRNELNLREFNHYICRNVDQLMNRLDQAILDVINNPDKT